MTHGSKRSDCCDDLNGFVEALRRAGDLVEIAEQMTPRFEMGALLRALGEREGPAALFTNVAGFPDGVIVGNVLGHRRRLAMALGVAESDLRERYLERKKMRIPPVSTPEAVVKEVIIGRKDVDLLKLLPALIHHEEDASPYLSCAVTLAKDPETGRQSMGMHRIQIQSERSMGIHLANPPLARFLHKARHLNRPLEVAVIIGPDPAVLIASVTWCPEGDDKVDIAGGLRQGPVEMVPCETVNLQVPARSQYLIEGAIQPSDLAHEGAFGDSSGVYVEAESPVIRVSAVSHRRSPLYQALQPWSSEDEALLNLCFGSDVLDAIQKDFPFVRDLCMVPGTVSGHAIASVGPSSAPARRAAMAATLTRNPFVKMLIVVDDDIDIRNYREVQWALATRFQADRDLLCIPGVPGSSIDPSASSDGSTCKIGMDATFSRERAAAFKKIRVPEASRRRAQEILDRALADFSGKKDAASK